MRSPWILQMLRRRLGEEAFWRALKRYGTEHRLCSVETSDLRKSLEYETGRSLERFFYDWTERPGHPILDVTSTYLPDTKQLRVAVKQTQSSEAFHFPLTVAFAHGESKPEMFTEEISTKEQVLFIPVGEQPTYVSLDPEQAVLAEIKENKSRAWWLAQLKSGDVAGRVRAAEYFGKEKSSQGSEAMAAALQEEKFWGVAAEAAAGLGEVGGDVSRDALIGGLTHNHPKVRRSCANHLGKFPGDAKAAAALKQLLEKGDASCFVEAAALAAYAKLKQPDIAAVLLPWLEKPSHNEVLRIAVLQGLANTRDWTCLNTLIHFAKPGNPRLVRAAALETLAELARTASPSDEQKQQVVGAITSCLVKGESTLIRRTAVSVLQDLGRMAAPALDALQMLASHDPSNGVRNLAQKAVDNVHKDTPQPVEVKQLREELERLRRSQEELRERLGRYEKIEQSKRMTP